jgi:hypothetical protein
VLDHAPFLLTGQHCGFTSANIYEAHSNEAPHLQKRGADFLPC